GFQQTQQHTNGRRLTRTVRTEIADHFPFVHFEVDVVDRDEIAEAAREIFDVDDRQAHKLSFIQFFTTKDTKVTKELNLYVLKPSCSLCPLCLIFIPFPTPISAGQDSLP